MIFLDTTTRKLEVLLGGVPSAQLPIVASYTDISTAAANVFAATAASMNATTTNSTTPVAAVAAPAASTTRKVSFVAIYNVSNATQTVTVRINDNGTLYTLGVWTLAAGITLFYYDAAGWAASTASTGMGIGNGVSSGTAYNILSLDGSANLSQVSPGTAGYLLTSNGTGAATSFQLFTGSASVTTLGAVNSGTWAATAVGPTYGGTGLTTYTLGDIPYASAANVLARLAGNTTSTKKFLTQTGTGSVSAAPSWGTLGPTDMPVSTTALIGSALFNANGQTLASATGVGTALYPKAAMFDFIPGSATFTGAGATFSIGYATGPVAATAVWDATTTVQGAAAAVQRVVPITGVVNRNDSLVLIQTGTLGAGNGTMTVVMEYGEFTGL